MGIIETIVIEIIITKIMEIDKEGIWSVSTTKKKDIRRMIVHYGSNIFKMKIRILNLRLRVNVVIVE
jgi:hypothetical protein